MLFELMREQEFLRRERELLRDLTQCLRHDRAPEAFRLSEQIAGDRDAVERAIMHLFWLLRHTLLEHVADGRYSSYIGRVKHLDRVATTLEESNVQARLALDALFLALQKK